MSKKRDQIKEAAHQLFIEKGFAATSIQDILDQAGIAKGTFYNYFNSKNECLRAILEAIRDEVDAKRKELATGKAKDDEEVFIEQMAVRLIMNRRHHLLTVFESVSFSEDEELKSFMKDQHQSELKWIAKRLGDLYPSQAKPYTFDHAVIFTGIIHHLMHVWKMGSAKDFDTEKVIRYAMKRVKSMIPDQTKNEDLFFPADWLGAPAARAARDSMRQMRSAVEELSTRIDEEGTEKDHASIQFLLTELETPNPRSFLLESVSLSLMQSWKDTAFEKEAEELVKLAQKILDEEN
ncbi:TetR/AcrR family transcriptional regulator [Halobacillus salinarum]|uniref:TetR/AcrR family transcriptional regulator n=1 Tax=Halobacillus salinarum TaxID=2932257 RepID=A0ABY4ELJ2_9BACI|nr:TetR/AcrR family transcriptional regulator [Halobacillus salinarum]UOQ44855.1 TetR/AcrR family transcriptional regulator [Halobacillus salinarum]